MKLQKLPDRIRTLNPSVTPTLNADAVRGNSTARGYGYRWQQAAAGFLQKHPLCVQCAREGFVCAAEEVDHIVPHRGDQVLFWNRENWQPLCKPCHSSKTASGQ